MLFYPKERAVCERVAAGAAPWSQRAQALWAGERAGLTHGQVRYWLGRFRQDGLSIFPEGEEAETTETKAAEAAKKPKKKKKQKKKTAKAKKTQKTKAKKKPKKKNAKKKGKG
jgi:succinate dehydrogenase/fumarate reductase flavoprotein subunit